MLREPDFVVDAGLLDEDARSLVQAGQEQPERNRVDALNVELLPLRFVFVDPGAEAKFGQDFGFFKMGRVSGTGLAVDDVGIAAVEGFDTNEGEVVSVGDFAYKLAALFAVFFFFLGALSTIFFGFVLALLNQLLNFFFFLFGVFIGERFVIFGDQALDLVAVEFHDFRGLDLG